LFTVEGDPAVRLFVLPFITGPASEGLLRILLGRKIINLRVN
jgi:hypothetical protein